eukprot:11199275-Lingulodinium_polyedra.AAC.1
MRPSLKYSISSCTLRSSSPRRGAGSTTVPAGPHGPQVDALASSAWLWRVWEPRFFFPPPAHMPLNVPEVTTATNSLTSLA